MNSSQGKNSRAEFSESDVILVTGASSGIGASIAQLLCERGATVIASGRDETRLASVRNKSFFPERMFLESKELTSDPESLSRWIASLVGRYGKLRGMVCSAGIASPMPLQLMDMERSQQIFQLDYFAPMFLAKGFCNRRHNVGKGASIVFLASMVATNPVRAHVAYIGAKAALVASARGIAQEYASNGIRINCISPAEVVTPMFFKFSEEYGEENPEDAVRSRYPLGLGHPEDIAPLAAFLLSDEARWITGQNYILDGGHTGCGANW